MINDTGARHGGADRGRLQQLAPDDLHSQRAQEGHVAAGSDQSPHVLAAPGQLCGNVAAEQPGRSVTKLSLAVIYEDIATKFFRSRGPSKVRKLSGWNWTP